MEDSEITNNSTTGSALPVKKKSARKLSSVANVMENTEIIDKGPTSTHGVLPIKRKSSSKPPGAVNVINSTVINFMSQFLDSEAAVFQSSQPIKKKSAVKPSTVVTVKSEVLDDGAATSQSVQPIKKKPAGKPSTIVNVTENTETIDNGTAPTQSAPPIKKKASRKPSKVVKRGTKAFEKDHFKPQRSVFIPITSETLKYKGTFFTRGDIVSVVDGDDRVYYAQIRGLLQNQYCEKSAVLTWLLPTTQSPKGKFDPQTYIFGHEEDIPRDLEYLEFVCHAPSEYFKCSDPSYPEVPQEPVLGFAETRKGYVIVKLPFEDFTTDSE